MIEIKSAARITDLAQIENKVLILPYTVYEQIKLLGGMQVTVAKLGG